MLRLLPLRTSGIIEKSVMYGAWDEERLYGTVGKKRDVPRRDEGRGSCGKGIVRQ